MGDNTSRRALARMPAAAFAALLSLSSCGQNDEPEAAKDLFARINAGEGFRSTTSGEWRRAPGMSSRVPSFTAHADAVEVFVNKTLASVLAGPRPVTVWPDGSIVVKEGYSGNSRKLVAVMEKRAGTWFWAEYDTDGDPKYSGSPSVCLDCHNNRAVYSDWVYSFEFPR